MDLPKNLDIKLKNLIYFLKNKKVIVAFSGGVDSSLLAFLSKKYAKKTLLITLKTALFPEVEIEDAQRFAKLHEIEQKIIEKNIFNLPNLCLNPKNRCYICKKELYSEIIKVKEKSNFDLILDGTNVDDLSDFRPGFQALKELHVPMPYVDFKINKKDIRDISKFYGLETYSKPSMACLASRIPYNQEITEKKLKMIKDAEKYLKERFNLKQLRVRFHKGKLARIELLKQNFLDIFKEENLELINSKFKEIGFKYITIDVEGYRSGSMN